MPRRMPLPASIPALFAELALTTAESDGPARNLSCIRYTSGDSGCSTSSWMPLLVIRLAWDAGLDLEDLADGFGAGFGTDGDWSAIRDSSRAALERMLERSLNFIAERLDVPRCVSGSDDEGHPWTRIIRPSQIPPAPRGDRPVRP